MARLLDALKSPWVVGFSAFGLAYGGYNIIDMSQSGKKYDLEEDLTGKTYIVTGATSGIGKALAQKLADNNARVIMACRLENGIVFACLLYGNLGKFEVDRIDGLVNNAAEMLPKRIVTPNGIEKSLATNHMGTFLLNGLMLEKLLKQDHPSKIIFLNTNIAASDKIEVNLEEMNNADELKKFDGFEAYKNSKVAELLFAKELAERLKDTNVSVVVADPGRTKSNLTSQMPFQRFFLSRWILNVVGFVMGERRTVKACKPILYATADPAANDKNGVFFDREREEQPWGANAENADLRSRLWLMSEVWTNFKEHLQKLNEEANIFEEGEGMTKTKTNSSRSWKWLWLK